MIFSHRVAGFKLYRKAFSGEIERAPDLRNAIGIVAVYSPLDRPWHDSAVVVYSINNRMGANR